MPAKDCQLVFETLMANGVFIKKSNAYMYAVVSALGIVFLLIMGSLFSAGAYTLVKGSEPVSDPAGTGSACFMAAGLYVLLLIFFIQQIHVHNRLSTNNLQLQ